MKFHIFSITFSCYEMVPKCYKMAPDKLENGAQCCFKKFHCRLFISPWRLGGFGNFRKKNSSFRLPYQRPSSFADCAGERPILKRIGQSSRLYSKKNFFPGGCGFFVSDVISEVVLGSFWLMLPGQGPNH